MKAYKFSPSVAVPFRFAFRRIVVLALLAVAATLCTATARAQNTQVTIEGSITIAGSVPGIIVGDKYSMVLYHNPTQTPSSTMGANEAFYTSYTLNTVVDDKDGNKSFTGVGEQILVDSTPGANEFAGGACCGITSSSFILVGGSTNAFKTDALPTVLNLADFLPYNQSYVTIGADAFGNITSIRVVDTDGIQPVFIVAGTPDPAGKVPEFNGVSGSGVPNLDIPVPLTLLTHGNSYVYTISLYDVNFTGTCQASFTLTQIQYNKTVTVDSGKDGTFSPTPETYWAYDFTGKVIPDAI
jgi:hypothetical protein